MTDREVERLSSGPVNEPLFLRAKDLQKIKGGLIDPVVFGANEDRWGHIIKKLGGNVYTLKQLRAEELYARVRENMK